MNLLKKLFDELEANAYNSEYHYYEYKYANQVIRKFFESNNLASNESLSVRENEAKENICEHEFKMIRIEDNYYRFDCTKCNYWYAKRI